MSINKLALDTVGKLDQYLGIIPSISAFNTILEQKTINLKYYISNLRRLVTMEKIFFGKENMNGTVKVCSNKTAEYNLFGQIIHEEKSDNEFQEIFNNLKQDQFIFDTKVDKTGCFDVKKNPKNQNFKFLHNIINSIQSENDLNAVSSLEPGLNQKSFSNLFEKMILTMDLLKELQNKNLMVDLNNKLSSIGCKFQNKLNLPLVGSIKGNPSSTVIYLLSYFESDQKLPVLQEINLQMKTMLEFLFKNTNFKNLVKKIGYTGGIIDNCFIRKILMMPERDKNLCILYCIVFKNDLFLNSSNDFMIDLKNNIEKNLKWNTVYHMGEFVTIPLD